MLRESSIPNEYYLGDKPGTLQYNKDPDEIMNCMSVVNLNTCGYVISEHSEENFKRLIPHTRRSLQFTKILLVIKKQEVDGTIWLKGALQDKITGKISLLTCVSNLQRLNRPIRSIYPGWYIGHYRMSAPMLFWNELKNRLKYSV